MTTTTTTTATTTVANEAPAMTSERRRMLAADRDAVRAMYPEPDGTDAMPDGFEQIPHCLEIQSLLKRALANRPDAFVSGNAYLYCVEGEPGRMLSPDAFVAFGVDEAELMKDNVYIVWRVGKVPDFVLEIGSPSAARRDLTIKMDICRLMGVPEYWLFDPTGGRRYTMALIGYRLVDGEYRRIELNNEPDGRVWGHSDVLSLDLWWESGKFRISDPTTGEFVLTEAEVDAGFLAATERADAAEERAGAVEAEYLIERSARRTAAERAEVAEARAEAADAERDAVAERAEAAELELRRLREQLRNQS